MERKTAVLNRNQIKYLVIAAMVIDHFAWAFVTEQGAAYTIMHFIGRLTGPVMAFFLVEGYRHTSNLKRYAIRLGVFGVISAPFFTYFDEGTLLTLPKMGVIYTLFLSLIVLILYDRMDLPPLIREGGIIVLCVLSIYGDWAVFDIFYALIFHRFYKEPKIKWALYCVTCIFCCAHGGYNLSGLYQLGMFIVPMLLYFYNGKRGSGAAFHKWFFYLFYPLHLLVLGILRWN